MTVPSACRVLFLSRNTDQKRCCDTALESSGLSPTRVSSRLLLQKSLSNSVLRISDQNLSVSPLSDAQYRHIFGCATHTQIPQTEENVVRNGRVLTPRVRAGLTDC